MRFFVLLLAFCCACRAALGNGASVWWPGWSVSSSEELSQGIRYSRNGYTPDFPLSLMLDQDPATAWVWSATSREWDTSVFSNARGVLLRPDRAVTIDGLRLMNGHNQSQARFRRNARALGIRVTLSRGSSKTTRSFALPDRRGWHSVKLPRGAIDSLRIEFVQVRGESGAGSDLCISELEMLDGGRRIDLRMPRAVMFYDGLEGCGASQLITRGGRRLAGIATDAGYSDLWSPSGRYVSGVAGPDDSLWIADAWRARIVPNASRIKMAPRDRKWLRDALAQARRVKQSA